MKSVGTLNITSEEIWWFTIKLDTIWPKKWEFLLINCLPLSPNTENVPLKKKTLMEKNSSTTLISKSTENTTFLSFVPLFITLWEDLKSTLMLESLEKMENLFPIFTLLEKSVEESTEKIDSEETLYSTVSSSEESLEELPLVIYWNLPLSTSKEKNKSDLEVID